MFRTLTQSEIDHAKPFIDRERNFILYSNLHVRQERIVCVGDFQNNHLYAFGGYLTGLPFLAFSLHVDTERYNTKHLYPARELINALRKKLPLQLTSDATGILTLSEEDAARIDLDGIRSKRTQLLMKLTDPAKLLPPQETVRLTGSDIFAVNKFVRQLDMMAFRQEELEELPHVAIYQDEQLVSMAGFHIFQDLYAEIGNIGTLPYCQGHGLGKQVTSDITRLGLEKTPHVYLVVFEDNAPAIHVYKSLGFETVQRYSVTADAK